MTDPAANHPPETPPDPETLEAGTSLWADAWRRLRRNLLAVISLGLFSGIALACFAGPLIYRVSPIRQDLAAQNVRPFEPVVEATPAGSPDHNDPDLLSLQNLADLLREQGLDTETIRRHLTGIVNTEASLVHHGREYRRSERVFPLGSDNRGRDLLARILYGGRISLGVGFLATAVSLLIGVAYGSVSGYIGGRTDAVMMRFVDILYALPFTVFVILLMVLFGRSIFLIFIAIGAVEWLTMARIVRGQVVGLKRQEFIEAAVALGYSTPQIVFRHIVPNILGPIIVYATLTVPQVMLLEAVLSFLGLGVQPPMASWGVLINDGRETMEIFPWQLLSPALLFSLTLFSLNFLGDGLRDALDPRGSRS